MRFIKKFKEKFFLKFDKEEENNYSALSQEFAINSIFIFYFHYSIALFFGIIVLFHKSIYIKLHCINYDIHEKGLRTKDSVNKAIIAFGVFNFILFEILRRKFPNKLYLLMKIAIFYFTIQYGGVYNILHYYIFDVEDKHLTAYFVLDCLKLLIFIIFFSSLAILKGYLQKFLLFSVLISQYLLGKNINEIQFGIWIIFMLTNFIYFNLDERKTRYLYMKRIKYEQTVNCITELIGKMSLGMCIISKKSLEIVYKNQCFEENYLHCEENEKITEIKEKCVIEIENDEDFKDKNIYLDALVEYLEQKQKKTKITNQTIAKISNSRNKNVTILIESSTIFWNNCDSIILLFENLDEKTELIKLKEENNYKDNVLSNVSHEFRTPLNCVIFMLESVKEEIEFNLIEDYIDPALGSTKMLLFQVNDLLDHAQIVNKKLKVSFNEVNVFQLGKELVKMFEFIAKTKNLEILFKIDNDVPEFIETDSQRLKQVIINLIGNSMKFTKTGSITLSIQKNNRIQIKFSIIDTGIGISTENQNKLFNEFSKITNNESNKMNPHGIGLGLVISNKIVKLLNNDDNKKLNVLSKENEGSTFYFFHNITEKANLIDKFEILPNERMKESCETEKIEIDDITNREKFDYLCFPELTMFQKMRKDILKKKSLQYNAKSLTKLDLEPQMVSLMEKRKLFYESMNSMEIINSKPDNKAFKISSPSIGDSINFIKLNVNVLTVDDSGMNLLVFTKMCKRLKISCTTATDGKECLKILEESPYFFDIIFMDCEMPIMDGFEATENIRRKIKNKEIKEIPIIACTGYSDDKEKNKCLKSGMNEVMVKPIDIDNFKKILHKYLKEDFPL